MDGMSFRYLVSGIKEPPAQPDGNLSPNSSKSQPEKNAHGTGENRQQSRKIRERQGKPAAIALSKRLADNAHRPGAGTAKQPSVPWEFGDV